MHRVMVSTQAWDALRIAADAQMDACPGLREAWLERACRLPDVLLTDRDWPLAFFAWRAEQMREDDGKQRL